MSLKSSVITCVCVCVFSSTCYILEYYKHQNTELNELNNSTSGLVLPTSQICFMGRGLSLGWVWRLVVLVRVRLRGWVIYDIYYIYLSPHKDKTRVCVCAKDHLCKSKLTRPTLDMHLKSISKIMQHHQN